MHFGAKVLEISNTFYCSITLLNFLCHERYERSREVFERRLSMAAGRPIQTGIFTLAEPVKNIIY
jgi:hypothetical protein